MKTALLYFFSLILIGTSQTFANPTLIDLNREWLKQEDINVHEIKNVPNDEVGKIKMHLRLVEQTLRNRSTDGLTKTQLFNRAKCLDVLHAYWQTGLFPQNEDYDYRTPIFIDKYNTFCAVGHIMKETGSEDIARAISENNNLIYVREIQNKEAALWIKVSGLTMEECAWIQPGYGGGAIKYNLDLSGLSTTTPIVNRAVIGPTLPVTFSATISSTGGAAPTFDANGNALFGLAAGTVQCINLSFQGAPGFLMRVQAASVLGGTFDSNDSLNLSSSFVYSTSNPLPFENSGLFGPSTYLVPLSDVSIDTSWFWEFFPINYTPQAQFTICASRTPTSSSTNIDLPVNLCVLVDASVQVKYNDFTLSKTNEDVNIAWSTLTENNNDYFTIEKSTDGSIWEAIGQVNSKGNSSTETKYSFIDTEPVIGKNWYRLQTTDKDNNSQYSVAKSINFGISSKSYEIITANPVDNEIVVRIEESELLDDDYSIINSSGQKLETVKQINASQLKFDVSHCPPGIYFLRSNHFNYKFLKK